MWSIWSTTSLKSECRSLLDPVGDEEVCLVRIGIVAVRRPNDAVAIGTEHRKAVEGVRGRHLLEAGSVRIDQKKVEIPELGVGMMVRGKDDFLSVGGPRGTKASRAQVRDLVLVAAVGVHDPEIHLVRSHQPLRQQLPVGRNVARGLGMVGSIYDPLAVGRPPRTPVVA